MDILTSIISIIMEYTVEPVGRQVGYLIHHKRNFENLRSQLKKLDATEDRIKHMIDEDERKGQKVLTSVQKWQTNANEMIQEANKLLGNEDHAKTKCFCGVCPNLVSYHQLSRKSVKLAKKIELDEKVDFTRVSYEACLEEIFRTPSEEYMAFESRISMVNKIMVELRNPDTNLVGVYGIGGVGKSILVQEVYRQAKKENLFHDVVLVLDIKQFPEAEKKERIQKKIAEKLGMDVQESQDMEARAKHLWNRIKDKKSLVILDDVWEAINLEDLGLLPMATCKILLTSRSLVSEMHTQKVFRLDVLGEKESWSLFEKMAGDVVKDDPIKKVATQISKECGGLPVLVVTVASSLRSCSTLEVWNDTLTRFRSLNYENYENLKDKANLAIEWSYNRLDAEELKPLFLLCGITAGVSCSFFLSDLLKYAMGLSLIKNVDTVEEAWVVLHSLAKKLKDSCLLLDSYDNREVRMHELVRDVAIRIASKDEHAFSETYGEVKEWPDRDSLKKCTAISLKSCKIPRLPEVPWVCPELRFFHLENHNIDDSLEIPGNYFEGMEELKVLDVTRLRIPSLPPSLQSLTNLQTLCLHQCVLGDIALVGQLTNLKILSLVHSQVKELPKEIGQLTRLQLLDLTGCSELVLISPGVISRLTSLEDLRMGINSFKQWEGEGSLRGRSNASVSELKQLHQLTALEIYIPDAKLLPANMFSDTRLERYTILIGDCWLFPDIDETSSNMLKLKLTTNKQFGQGIKLLLKRCEHLELDGMEAANIISYILASDSGKQLKNLHVQNNDAVTAVINSSHAFPILESLSLDNLLNLESVCCGQPISQPFQKLRSLTLRNLPKLIGFSSKGSRSVVSTEAEEIILENEIGGPTELFMNEEVLMLNLTRLILHQCDGLRFLFSSSTAKSLEQLEHIEISKCQMMEEIVSTSGYNQEHTYNMFCNLKSLKLQRLPSLTKFCSGSYIEFSLLEKLHIEDCPRLGTFILDGKSEITTMGKENDDRNSKENLETVIPHFLFDEKVGFPSLESLIIYDITKFMTIWHRQLAPNSFRKLKKVEVWRCQSLINIFAPSMMGRLNALSTLVIKQCKSLQVVFDMGVVLGVKEAYGTSSTTQLKTFGCPNLDLVVMDSCDILKNIFPASVAKGLQQLSELYVENCGTLEEIVAKEGVETTPTEEFVFSKVTLVQFQFLPQLRSFYSGLHVSRWPLLKSLTFFECGKVEILASEYSRFQERLDSGLVCTPIKQPFLLVDKVLMPNITRLIFHQCDGLRFLFSCSMAISLIQLTHLEIASCQIMEEIVTKIGSSEENTDGMFCNLKYLELQHLPSLTRFCSGSYIEFSLLETLHIEDCPRLGTFIFDGKSEITTMDKENDDRNSTENLETVIPHFLFYDKVLMPNITRLILHQCDGLRFLFSCSMAVSLVQLTHLEIASCQIMEEIVTKIGSSEENTYGMFCNLKYLELQHLPSLTGFCSGSDIEFSLLETLHIEDCPRLGTFISDGKSEITTMDKENDDRNSKENLETVIPHFLFYDKVLMPNITRLILHQCDGLRFLFSCSMAVSLVQLTHLEIASCQIMEEIVTKIGSSEENTYGMFCNLKYLELQHLPSLTGFCSGSDIEFSLLETLHIEDCPRLGTFISDGKSEITTMDKENDDRNSKENLETVIPHFLFYDKVLMANITRLILHQCDGLRFLFSCSMAISLVQLTHLEIASCQIMEEIVTKIGSSEENTYGMFCNLKYLELQHLPSLTGFCSGSDIEFSLLETLHIEDCPRLGTFISDGKSEITTMDKENDDRNSKENLETVIPHFLFYDKVLMANITRLILHQCDGLRFLFSCSMAISLVQLTHLEIASCQIMEEIVTKIGSSEENTYGMFCNLKYLELQHLPSLTRFCSGSYIEFSLLETLHIEDCPRLGTFIFDGKSEITTMDKENDDRNSKENLETVIPHFLFDEKVGFPSLESLIIYNIPKLRTIWHRQLAPDSFRKLKIVKVLRCWSLINIFAPSMMGRLNALGTLEIKQCKSLQVVFDMGVALGVKEAYGTSSTTQLKTFECPNLDLVVLDSCDKLKSIFPASLAKGLQQLSKLYVGNCGILKEIVAKDGLEMTPTEKFVFSKVTLVQLQFMPQLRSFFSGLHVSKWPLLKSLKFFECGKVEIFASEYSRFQERLDSAPIKQPFLLVDKEGNPFPNLEVLDLDENVEIWYEAYGPLPAELFINLKEFAFSCAHPQSFHFLEKLHNLEELIVYNGPWKEIFVYEGTSSEEIDAIGRTLPHIKNLCLNKMEELMHLGIGNDNSESVFPNVEILKVYNCGRLKNLTSSAISFHNLTTLHVVNCEGLKYLTTYSVAKCLHQLKSLKVENCESMIEIVASNEDEEDSGNYYEIAFSCLQHLKLYYLPSLRGFCSSGNCTVRVPSLNSLIIEECLIELKISPDGSLIQSGSRPERQQITEEVEEKEEEEEEDDDGNETGGRMQLIAHTN